MPKGVGLKPGQVVAKLREIEVKLSQGKDVLTACREAGATDKPFFLDRLTTRLLASKG